MQVGLKSGEEVVPPGFLVWHRAEWERGRGRGGGEICWFGQ
jgi:hypothetical protein